jgi:hypothetical protein
MTAIDTLIEQLARETGEACAAARAGDGEACAAALTGRGETLHELSTRLEAHDGPHDARVTGALQRVQRQDTELRETLAALRDTTRAEIERVRAARSTASHAASAREPARFVCERV